MRKGGGGVGDVFTRPKAYGTGYWRVRSIRYDVEETTYSQGGPEVLTAVEA